MKDVRGIPIMDMTHDQIERICDITGGYLDLEFKMIVLVRITTDGPLETQDLRTMP